jgi:hypothetical protein
VLGVNNERTSWADDDVIEVGTTSRHAPIVQESHTAICQPPERLGELLLTDRAAGPSLCALRVAGECDDQPAEPRVRFADTLLTFGRASLVFAAR